VIQDTPSVSQLSQVISQAIAPAFILGALAAFISLLILRMNRVVDRSQTLNAIGGDDPARVHLKTDLPRLKQRALLLNRAILYAAISAIFATLLVMVAFVSAFFEPIQEELESNESVVIPCSGMIRDRSTKCGSLNTV
jgi:uncharacterized membrane protein YgcG